MVHWLEIIYFLLLLAAIWRCLYFWQLKEYRLDRFKAFLSTSESGRYWLPGRHWFRPHLTIKILILSYLAIYFSIMVMQYFPQQRLAPIVAYLLVPLTAGLAVVLLQPITDLAIGFLVGLAWVKLRLWHRRLVVIGITGSYGKTSTKEILAHVLAIKFKVAKTQETINTLVGVAKTVLFKLNPADQIFVVEMGAYKIGEIRAMCRLVKPRIGILTGINQQHLALFGSQDQIIQAKSELLRALPKTGLAVVNGTSPLARRSAGASQAQVKFYRQGQYQTNLIGQHQQLNIAAAVKVAQYLGVKTVDFTKLPQFKTAITRSQGLNQATIINDSYNSNPDGFAAAIDLVSSLRFKKNFLLTSGIIELGREGDSVQRCLAVRAKPVFDKIFTTKAEASRLFGAKQYGETELLKVFKKILTKNHLLLIEGRFSPKFIRQLCSNPS
ncbi:MAG: Mur ligase family protein [Patescibacteria group bacterium]|nr:Mur ligase family protein [Patescibacteria group bacterium]